MIVCYDNTVNRQKLADVDCSLDTARIPTGSQRDTGRRLGWMGWTDTWSQGDPVLKACVKAQPQICLHFMFHKSSSLVCIMIPFACCRLTCPYKPRTFIKRWWKKTPLKSQPVLICHGAVSKLSGRELVLMYWFRVFMFSSHSLRWNAHFIKVMEGCCSICSPHECKVGFASLKTFSEIWMLNYKALVRAELGR